MHYIKRKHSWRSLDLGGIHFEIGFVRVLIKCGFVLYENLKLLVWCVRKTLLIHLFHIYPLNVLLLLKIRLSHCRKFTIHPKVGWIGVLIYSAGQLFPTYYVCGHNIFNSTFHDPKKKQKLEKNKTL